MDNRESLILYMIVFLVSSLLLVICKKYNKHKIIRKILFLAAIILPILILGMRHYVGTDYENYLIMYNKYKSIPLSDIFSTNIEILTVVLCKLIYVIHDNKYLFILIYAILTITISFKAILNIDSKNIFLITFMYLCLFFPLATNGMRQSLAIAIILYAYTILFKNYRKFCLLCIIAFFVHSSAIIVLPIGIVCYAIKDVKKCSYILICIYSILILVMILGLPLASSNIFLQKLVNYIGANGDIKFGIGVLFLNLPILLLSLFFYRKNNKNGNNKEYCLFIVIFIISIMLSYLGYINIALNRFAYYFSIIQILLIPKGLDIFKDNGIRRVLELVFVIVMVCQFINDYYVNDSCEIFPYDHIELSDLSK